MRSPAQVNVRRDPSLNRALEFALAEHVIGVTFDDSESKASVGDVRIFLAENGKRLLQHIQSTPECFTAEREFLAAIGKRVTQSDIARLFSGGL